MFNVKLAPKSASRPLRTMAQEVKATRAKYNEYLRTTTNEYVAQNGNVKIHHTPNMVGDTYNILKGSLNEINKAATKANKEVVFKDAKAEFKSVANSPYLSPEVKKDFASKIYVEVTTKGNPLLNPKSAWLDASPKQKVSLLKQVSNVLGEIFTGKKGANIDKELGLK